MERTTHYASRSRCTQRHAALVYKSGKVLSIATNKYHNDPRMFEHDALNEVKDKIGIHAEVAAVRLLDPQKVRGATIYVARLRRSGEIGSSRPCENCEEFLLECGIRKVVYTDV